jgi:hypothetical protein
MGARSEIFSHTILLYQSIPPITRGEIFSPHFLLLPRHINIVSRQSRLTEPSVHAPANNAHTKPAAVFGVYNHRIRRHSSMGEWSEFSPGHQAPNDGVYIEVGEVSFHMGISNPRRITLHQGERFPDTSNKDRKWKRLR